jgi:hypothetical protein
MSGYRRFYTQAQLERAQLASLERAILEQGKQYLLDQCVREPGPIKNSPCWIWTGSVWGGYGRMFFGGGHTEASHRVSWIVHVGPIPEGMWALHRCDVKLCCEHTHLWLGTAQDNVDDMMRKGRNVVAPPTKFTRADILEMREMAAQGHTYAFIAKCVGADPGWVGPVVRGEVRKDVGGPITIIDRPQKTSRFVGVYWQKSDKRWMARIKINGVTRFIGNFTDEIRAARAYNNAIIRHNLNRPLNEIDEPEVCNTTLRKEELTCRTNPLEDFAAKS